MNKKDRQPQAVFSLALFVLMLGCVLALTMFGARVYRALTDSQARNQTARASLTYVAARLHAADERNGVRIEHGAQGDVLILGEELDNTGYETRIYLHEGMLLEDYCAVGSESDPDFAQRVAQTDSFTITVEGNLISVTTGEGTVCVCLHSGEGEP